jgi:hypothetical protein
LTHPGEFNYKAIIIPVLPCGTVSETGHRIPVVCQFKEEVTSNYYGSFLRFFSAAADSGTPSTWDFN